MNLLQCYNIKELQKLSPRDPSIVVLISELVKRRKLQESTQEIQPLKSLHKQKLEMAELGDCI